MNAERFIERLLETENLTDNLEDDEANLLIDWGVARVTELVQGIGDEQVAGEKVTAIMRFMRTINTLAPSPEEISAEGLLGLLERHTRAFGASRTADETECQSTAERLSAMSVAEAVQFLLEWVLPTN